MKLTIELTGTTPLLMHNVRLANPDNEFAKAIAAITSKRKKTEEDRQEMSRLEWFGGIYADNDGPFMPSTNIHKCFVETAKIHRLAKAVVRGVVMYHLQDSLDYDGPTSIESLWKLPQFRFVTPAKVMGKTVIRTRPCFPKWVVTTEVELLTDVLDEQQFRDLVALAGLIEGLGDGRSKGYGRFTAVVKSA